MAKGKSGSKPNHVFRGIRDPVVLDASTGSPTLQTCTSDGSGNISMDQSISPLGVSAPVGTVSSGGGTVTWSFITTQGAKHPWLYNQARNFGRFRITRYVLIFVSNQGANVTGQVAMTSSTDITDTASANWGASTSSGGKVFDLSSGANRELRLNCDVDTSWKKVTSLLFVKTGNALVTTSSANDLVVTNWFFNVSGGPANQPLGSLYAEYDVEFRDPISYGVNV